MDLPADREYYCIRFREDLWKLIEKYKKRIMPPEVASTLLIEGVDLALKFSESEELAAQAINKLVKTMFDCHFNRKNTSDE